MFDNTYFVDKLVQALALAVIYWILIDREMTHLLVLFGSAFIIMVSLDVFQGKVGNSIIPIYSLTNTDLGQHFSTKSENTLNTIIVNSNINNNNNDNSNNNNSDSSSNTTTSSSNSDSKIFATLKDDQTRLNNATSISLDNRDPGKNHSSNFGREPKKVTSCMQHTVKSSAIVGGQVIEPMDDPVARLYYSSGKLPSNINEEALLGQQLNLDEKCSEYSSYPRECNLPQTGAEGVLFDTYHQREQYLVKLRKDRNQSAGGWIPQSGSESTKFWNFGTFNFTLDGTGSQHFRAAPFCTDKKIDACIKHDPILGDPLKNDILCSPCGMEGLSSELTQPLKDRIVREGPYRECRENLTCIKETQLLKPTNRTIVQPHYVPDYQGGSCLPCKL